MCTSPSIKVGLLPLCHTEPLNRKVDESSINDSYRTLRLWRPTTTKSLFCLLWREEYLTCETPLFLLFLFYPLILFLCVGFVTIATTCPYPHKSRQPVVLKTNGKKLENFTRNQVGYSLHCSRTHKKTWDGGDSLFCRYPVPWLQGLKSTHFSTYLTGAKSLFFGAPMARVMSPQGRYETTEFCVSLTLNLIKETSFKPKFLGTLRVPRASRCGESDNFQKSPYKGCEGSNSKISC